MSPSTVSLYSWWSLNWFTHISMYFRSVSNRSYSLSIASRPRRTYCSSHRPHTCSSPIGWNGCLHIRQWRRFLGIRAEAMGTNPSSAMNLPNGYVKYLFGVHVKSNKRIRRCSATLQSRSGLSVYCPRYITKPPPKSIALLNFRRCPTISPFIVIFQQSFYVSGDISH